MAESAGTGNLPLLQSEVQLGRADNGSSRTHIQGRQGLTQQRGSGLQGMQQPQEIPASN